LRAQLKVIAVERQDSAALLALAQKLREAAAIGGRTDVVAKVDDVIRQISAGGDAERDPDKANAVIRFLDGLGF
jgi:hypothetical protein